MRSKISATNVSVHALTNTIHRSSWFTPSTNDV